MMRLSLKALMLIACLAAVAVQAGPQPVPSAPSVDAKGYILLDFDSGKVLAAKDPDKRMEPASITKLMTGYIVYRELAEGHASLDDQVTISKKAWKMKGSRMFVEVDDQVALEDLLTGMIVQSGNDASVALAEHIAGSESAFADLMNSQAQALGMDSTHYVNATGWPHEDHYTTARDIATLARALIRDFPKHYERYARRKFTYNGITQYNRNLLLLRDDSVDGIKTGHTEDAGYCLVASAERDAMRLISVVLGSSSEDARAEASQALLNYGFRFYETHRLYAAQEPLTEARVWKGEREQVPLGLKEDLYVTIPEGRYEALEASMALSADVEAPVEAGTRLGTVEVKLADEPLTSRPLVSLESVGEGGLWRWLKDSVLQLFQ